MDRSAGRTMSAGSTVCSQDPSVIARPGKNTQIIRHAYGGDYSLPDPQFAAAILSYRSGKIAIERLLPPEDGQCHP